METYLVRQASSRVSSLSDFTKKNAGWSTVFINNANKLPTVAVRNDQTQVKWVVNEGNTVIVEQMECQGCIFFSPFQGERVGETKNKNRKESWEVENPTLVFFSRRPAEYKENAVSLINQLSKCRFFFQSFFSVCRMLTRGIYQLMWIAIYLVMELAEW